MILNQNWDKQFCLLILKRIWVHPFLSMDGWIHHSINGLNFNGFWMDFFPKVHPKIESTKLSRLVLWHQLSGNWASLFFGCRFWVGLLKSPTELSRASSNDAWSESKSKPSTSLVLGKWTRNFNVFVFYTYHLSPTNFTPFVIRDRRWVRRYPGSSSHQRRMRTSTNWRPHTGLRHVDVWRIQCHSPLDYYSTWQKVITSDSWPVQLRWMRCRPEWSLRDGGGIQCIGNIITSRYVSEEGASCREFTRQPAAFKSTIVRNYVRSKFIQS